MGVVDPQLRDIGKECGLEIWRIKDFGLEKLPKEQHGNFYSGDSYIVLSTVDPEQSIYNVHFWLGKDTTVDERGTAAIKTVELDEALGGHPVQYREVQNHESSMFLSYFKDGIKYLQGGVASGFRHVVENNFDDWTPRLFHCKGKRNVRCTQARLPKVFFIIKQHCKVEVVCERNSLNLGDVFILDCGNNIYVWMPPDSGRLERIKAITFLKKKCRTSNVTGMRQAQSIRDQERSGTASVHCLDEDWDSNEEFWEKMGGSEDLGDLKSPEDGGDDEDFWRTTQQAVTLVRVSDASGEMKATLVSEGSFDSSQLDSTDAFILNTGTGGIFVWVGKQCTMDERCKSMEWAKIFLQQQGLPDWTQVIRVFEGEEPTIFTQWATNWEKDQGSKTTKMQAKLIQCSDRKGRFVAEEIANFTQEDLDGDDVMILDTGDIIYVWVGAQTSASEKENVNLAAAVGLLSFANRDTLNTYIKTSNIPRNGEPTVEIIDQGSEPAEFTQHFKSWNDTLFKSVRLFRRTFRRHARGSEAWCTGTIMGMNIHHYGLP
uniref:Gelsolin-like domain-containing protein n=1 Tax=Ascaris lumbricoides TaxID=6252 RepID=A0A9J2PXZ7_ASCLU